MDVMSQVWGDRGTSAKATRSEPDAVWLMVKLVAPE
jgi:hypothetical protein